MGMLEALVLSVCITGNGNGCGNISKAYYNQSLEAQRLAREIQIEAEKDIGKENLALLGTVSGLIFIKKGTINIDNHLNFVILSNTGAIIQLHFEQ